MKLRNGEEAGVNRLMWIALVVGVVGVVCEGGLEEGRAGPRRLRAISVGRLRRAQLVHLPCYQRHGIVKAALIVSVMLKI